MMTSLSVEVLLYNESLPEQRDIILLQPYKILRNFLDKLRSYSDLKKAPRF